jgi:hypothetical protein
VLLRDLCEDIPMTGHHAGSLLDGLGDATLQSLMEEISDPRLRGEVLTLAQGAARADEHLADGEALVLGAASRYWSLSPSTSKNRRCRPEASESVLRGLHHDPR